MLLSLTLTKVISSNITRESYVTSFYVKNNILLLNF
jgi:hypothetical protein